MPVGESKYSFGNYIFCRPLRHKFFTGYPRKELTFLAQNLGVEATTDGCSRQCTDCGVNPPAKIRVMPFWMIEELAPLALRIIPYLRGEPFDFYDPVADRDISDIVEENFRYAAQTQITTAFWNMRNPIASRAARRIRLEQVDDFRLSIHLFWPEELLEQRKCEIANGCRIFWDRGFRSLVSRITYDSETELPTRDFVAHLEEMFPGLLLESRKLFVPIVRVGRTRNHPEADVYGEVFFNKLVLLPDGSLSVSHRRGDHYRYQATGLSLLEPFDPEKFRIFVSILQTYLPIRAQGYPSSAEFIKNMRARDLWKSPEFEEMVEQGDMSSVCQKFLDLVMQIPKMDPAVHKFCHDIFSFDEPEVENMVSEILCNENRFRDIEVVRRAIDFVLRKDSLGRHSEEITDLVIRRVFGRNVIDAETSFQVALLDVLGFLPENRTLIQEWLARLDSVPCTDFKVREKIELALKRLINRIDYITSEKFPTGRAF